MIINVVFNTKEKIDFEELINKIYKKFGDNSIICCPRINFFIEGEIEIKDYHRIITSLKYSEVIIYVCKAYSTAAPINKIIRALQLNNNNVYNWLTKDI